MNTAATAMKHDLNTITKWGANCVVTERDALTALADAIQGTMAANFTQAVETMLAAKGRVIISGMGKSGHIARKIAATMASVGTPAHFVHPGEASHGDLGMVVETDVVILISNGGESPELADIITHTRRFSIPMIAITSKPESTLGKAADIILQLPQAAEACPMGMAPTTSTTLTLALGDALSVALMEARGFTKQDYGIRHPGGKLGKMLLKVSDLMHKDDAMPLIIDTATMQAAILEMTKKRLGTVAVTDANGNLAGIITDGDLRRHMSMDLTSKSVRDVMTPNPKTVDVAQLAVEAVALMQEKSITKLIAMDNGRPVGLLDIHDCLKAGIA